MKRRLPRKRKKWLKQFGGFEYAVQIGYKTRGEATIEDFKELMNILEANCNKMELLTWPPANIVITNT